MKIDKPGIYQISNEDYHKDPCVVPSLSRGTISDLLDLTPLHAWANHPRLNPNYIFDDGESRFDIGTAVHSLFLEGKDCCEVIDAPDWRGKDAKSARDDARLAGKTPLLKHQYESALLMVDAAHMRLAASELAIKDLHAEGDAEMSYIWQDGDQHTWCRVRPDWISHKNIGGRKLILDLKTTGMSADPTRFKATDHGKDIQQAFYKRGVKEIEGGKAPRFIFMLVETFPPYACSFIGLDPQTAEIAKQKVEFGLFQWQKCTAMNDWPGYPNRVCYVETPPWQVAQWEAKAAEIGNE